MEQKRLVIWVILSVVILTAWSFLVPYIQPESSVSQTKPAPLSSESAAAPATSQPQVPNVEQPSTQAVLDAADTLYPQRSVTIATPLYEVKFDSKGAVPTSWIIKKTKIRIGLSLALTKLRLSLSRLLGSPKEKRRFV
ncbi:MAG: hypothetical protein WKF84_07640 [Pyrinomonadaceae bacterium]